MSTVQHNTIDFITLDPGRDFHVNGETNASAFYSSKIKRLTGDLTVRQWLSKKSFAEQYEFGRKVLRDVGAIK